MVDWLVENNTTATWILIVTWAIGFVLTNYMLVGWYRVLIFIRRVTQESNAAVSQALIFLWTCVFSSLVFPLGALFCPVQNVLALVSIIMCLMCVWAFVRFLLLDKEKCIKRVILGQDFVSQHSLDDLEYDDLLVLGRRRRMLKMYDEFRTLQEDRARVVIDRQRELEDEAWNDVLRKRNREDANHDDLLAARIREDANHDDLLAIRIREDEVSDYDKLRECDDR